MVCRHKEQLLVEPWDNWKMLDLFKDPEVEMELKDAGAEVPWLGDHSMPEARIEFVFYAKNMESCLNVF